jgi:integrase
LNLYALRHYHLKVACLPIPPYAQPDGKYKALVKFGKSKKTAVLTSVLTGRKKPNKKGRFQRVGHGLFRFKSTGIIYAVFKSAGKTRWKNLGTDDVRQARELLGEEIQREAKVDWKRARSINLLDLIQHYESNPMNLAPSTLRTRTLLLKVFKETWPFGLTMKVRDVKTFMLRLWLAERRSARNLKSAGMNNYLRTLHSLFGLAVELGAIAQNIALEIKLVREPNPDRLTPTWEQAQTIIEAVKRPRSKLALTAMLLFGIGQGEIKNLRGEHFNLEQSTITIRRQKTQKVFTIPIFPQAQAFVEKLRAEGRLEFGKRVFDMCNPREALVITCERLNLPLFTPRSFRRAFIIRALEKGIDPRVVAAWQGHRDATLILRVYGSQINHDHHQRMASLLA